MALSNFLTTDGEPSSDDEEEGSGFRIRRIFGFSGSTGFSIFGTNLGVKEGGSSVAGVGRRRRILGVAVSSDDFGSEIFGDEGGLTGKSGGFGLAVSVAAFTRRLRGSGFFGSGFSGSSSLLNKDRKGSMRLNTNRKGLLGLLKRSF